MMLPRLLKAADLKKAAVAKVVADAIKKAVSK